MSSPSRPPATWKPYQTPAEVAATAEFVINRREYGIVYAGMPDNLIRDDVAMHLRLRAARAAR